MHAASTTNEGAGLTGSCVLVVDDDQTSCALIRLYLEAAGHRVETFLDAEGCLDALTRVLPDAICLDLSLPGVSGLQALERIKSEHALLPVLILTGDSRVDTVVSAMRLGAYDYIVKPVDETNLKTTVRNAVERHRMSQRLAQLEREASGQGYAGIIGQSPTMKELFRQMDRIVPTDITVLIHGESGTGKELIAQAIHEGSGWKKGQFVAVNCAAIPETLQESELFGHEKGAFTNASARRVGRFEQADGGTLFLDEVAELSLSLQAKLLRALQERSFYRVGGTTEVRSRFRLISATHRDLAGEVREGRFREDLYFRLAVFELEVPPLRDRRRDIPLLVDRFIADLKKRHGDRAASVSGDSMDALLAYAWPGNIRELENAIHRAFVIADGEIRPRDLPPRILATAAASAPPATNVAHILPAPHGPSWPLAAPQADAVDVASTERTERPERPDSPAASAALPRQRDASEEVPTVLPPSGAVPAPRALDLEALEREAIEAALRRNSGNITETVRELGIGRTTLYRKLKKYRIGT